MVFPGQGSQSVGMLAELGAAESAVRDTFTEASDALGVDLWALTQDGPEEELNRTDRTQPAMLAAGVAIWRVWQSRGGDAPVALAGHSLGEYTALVCAGALDFAAALRVVRLRGEWMQQAVPAGEGAMAAVLGLDDEAVVAACLQAEEDGGVVEAVNFNAPGQVVIAGNAAAVARAIERAKSAGAKRAMTLPVSVPSHCRLMAPVSERLAAALAEVEIRAPGIPVFHNVDAAPRHEATRIRAALAEQVRRPVRWVECVRAMQAAGVRTLVEAGPGRVLSGLARRIDRDIAAFPADDPDTLGSALAAVKGTDDD